MGAPNTPLLLRVERIVDEGLLIRRPRFNASGSLFREREVKRLGIDRGPDGLGFSIVGGYDEKLGTCAPFTVGRLLASESLANFPQFPILFLLR